MRPLPTKEELDCNLYPWLYAALRYSHLQNLSSRAEAAREFAKIACELDRDYFVWGGEGRWWKLTLLCPGVSVTEMRCLANFILFPKLRPHARHSIWLKPSLVLEDQRFLQPEAIRMTNAFLSPEVLSRRSLGDEHMTTTIAGLETMARNRELVSVIDECWNIAYSSYQTTLRIQNTKGSG